jgi:non-ribosomal peptide synthase protein (TIGR01720 family)
LRIDLEGHGRDARSPDVDVSRTVGWFTSLYPVRLIADARPAATLRTVRTTLRHVPRSGVGYGVLRYLGGSEAAALCDAGAAEILVNYLGQLDQALGPAGALRPGAGPTGPMRNPDGEREYLLELNGIVSGGQLRLAWTYSTHFDALTIRRLIDRFVDCLHAIVADALIGAADDVMTASDFKDADLDEDELRRLAQLLDRAERV